MAARAFAVDRRAYRARLLPFDPACLHGHRGEVGDAPAAGGADSVLIHDAEPVRFVRDPADWRELLGEVDELFVVEQRRMVGRVALGGQRPALDGVGEDDRWAVADRVAWGELPPELPPG